MIDEKRNFTTKKKIIFFFVVLLICLFFLFISFLTKYYAQIKWWYRNSGDSICNSKFNIILFLLSYENSIINKLFSSFFSNKLSDLNRQQIMFLTDIVLSKLKRENYKGHNIGFVLPRHICNSIMFKKGDNDFFDTWLEKKGLSTDIFAEYDGKGKLINKGVYPRVESGLSNHWQQKINEWCGKDWEFTEVENQKILVPYIIDTNDVEKTMEEKNSVNEEWYSLELHPDNFLARYAIDPASPLVISFYNNSFNYKSIKTNPQAMKNLIGYENEINKGAGGWVGFLLKMGDVTSYDDYMNYLYSDISLITTLQKEDECDLSKDIASPIANGIVSGFGAGTMLMFLGNQMPPGAGLIAGGLILGLGAAMTTAISSVPAKCKKDSKFLSAFGTSY